MPKVVCPAGRTNKDGTPKWHRKDGADCPVCSKNVKLAPATEISKPNGASGASEGGKSSGEETTLRSPPEAKRPGIMRRLGFGARETSPELPNAPPKNPEPSYFVDAKHTIAFANTVYGGIRWTFDRWDDWAQTEAAGMVRFVSQHGKMLALSDIEKQGIELDPQTDLWGKFATGFTRMLGSKTQGQAHGIISLIQTATRFGALLTFGVAHIMESYRKGKPFRKAAAEAKKEALRVKANERKQQGASKLAGIDTGNGLSGVRQEPQAAAA